MRRAWIEQPRQTYTLHNKKTQAHTPPLLHDVNMTCCCSVGTYDIQLKFYAFFDFFRAYWLTISNKNVDFAEFQLTNQLEQFFFSVWGLEGGWGDNISRYFSQNHSTSSDTSSASIKMLDTCTGIGSLLDFAARITARERSPQQDLSVFATDTLLMLLCKKIWLSFVITSKSVSIQQVSVTFPLAYVL